MSAKPSKMGDSKRKNKEQEEKEEEESPLYSIIIPCYNERENLPILVQMIDDELDGKYRYELIIVEDSSPDGTFEVACSLRDLFGSNKIDILKRKGKLGLGSAYMDGLKRCNGDFVLIMDADFSHHPKYIPIMIEKQMKHDSDIVSGTRYALGGGVSGWDLKRKLVSRGANRLARTLLAIDDSASDLTGSFRLYKHKVITQIMSEMTGTGYVFQMEIMVRAMHLGFQVSYVPIVFVDRLFGESKLGAMEIGKYLMGLLTLMIQF